MTRNIPPRRISRVAVARHATRTDEAQGGTILFLILGLLLLALFAVRG